MISKSWSTSKKRAAIYRTAGELAEFCLQLFPLLVAHSDDYGRQDADTETIRLVCDPGSPRPFEAFERALDHFEAVGLIQRYTADGKTWLQIVKFDDHQPGLLSKRTKSKSPYPPTDTETAGNSVLRELNLTQPNLTQEKKNGSAETSSAPAPRGSTESRERPFLTFPAIGPVTEWALSEAQVAEWERLYPVVDVRGEMRKAVAWLVANTGRRKTAKGMARFLVNWLSRAVDSGRGMTPARPKDDANAYTWTCPHEPQCLGRHACSVKQTIAAGKTA